MGNPIGWEGGQAKVGIEEKGEWRAEGGRGGVETSEEVNKRGGKREERT
jgi:hypothetical protein